MGGPESLHPLTGLCPDPALPSREAVPPEPGGLWRRRGPETHRLEGACPVAATGSVAPCARYAAVGRWSLLALRAHPLRY